MLYMFAGIILFVGTHLITSLRPVRAGIISTIGEMPYKGIYSLLSLGGVVLMVMALDKVNFILLYLPPAYAKTIAPVFMLPAFILLAAAFLPSNIKRFTRHPMLWAFTLWAAAHLIANGDLASFLFFGTFGAYSLFGMISQNARGAEKSTNKVPLSKDAIVIVLGVVLYVGLVLSHRWLFGVAVM